MNLFGLTLTVERMRVAAAIFFVALLGWQVWNGPWPEFQTYLDRRSLIEKQQGDIDGARSMTVTREQLLTRQRAALANLQAMRAKFPPRNQILSILLVDLSSIFQDTGMQLVSLEPTGFKALEQTSVKDLGRLSMKVTAWGEYPSIIMLFEKLSRYDRVIQIDDPKITPMGTGGGDAAAEPGPGGSGATGNSAFSKVLTVDFTLTTFALNR